MIVTLQNAKHETVIEFNSELFNHFPKDGLPDIVTWNGRQHVFLTIEGESVKYVQAFNCALVEGVTVDFMPPPLIPIRGMLS